ncbi:MAG: hypothetical protein FJX36_06940 [Alphaproteobacteria bacterium]|nr:hypothetical protein [Alphaproteobacteria bacterium]
MARLDALDPALLLTLALGLRLALGGLPGVVPVWRRALGLVVLADETLLDLVEDRLDDRIAALGDVRFLGLG